MASEQQQQQQFVSDASNESKQTMEILNGRDKSEDGAENTTTRIGSAVASPPITVNVQNELSIVDNSVERVLRRVKGGGKQQPTNMTTNNAIEGNGTTTRGAINGQKKR